MAGYTDSLVLVSSAFWWPSFKELHQHPILPERSFAAAITAHGASLGDDSVPLSRVGESLFHFARWGNEKKEWVDVYNLFQGEYVSLMVDAGSNAASDVSKRKGGEKTGEEGEGSSLRKLAEKGRIRLRPTYPTIQERKEKQKTVQRTPQDCFFESYLQGITKHWMECVKAGENFRSIVVSGNLNQANHMIRYVMEHTPEQITITTTIPSSGEAAPRLHHIVVEKREINLLNVLSMDEREALAYIRAAFQTPPTPRHSDTSTPPLLQHCLIVQLASVDLLSTTQYSHTAVLVNEIVSRCDDLQGGVNAPGNKGGCVMVLSSAEYPQDMHPVLRSRLGQSQLPVSPPSPSECAECIRTLLSSMEEKEEEGDNHHHHHNHNNKGRGNYSTGLLQYAASRLSSAFPMGELITLRVDTLIQWIDGPVQAQYQQVLLEEEREASASGEVGPYRHLYGVRECLTSMEELLVWPLLHLTELQALHIQCTKGALLHGPTGCGKTAVMTALAKRLQALQVTYTLHVLVVDGLSLIEKEVGRTEKNITQLFQQARTRTPAVLFIDNLDALAPPRGCVSAETDVVADRSLSTLLTEMDGVSGDPSRVVLVVASAPSPDRLDPAVCRPGRLDVHVGLHVPSLEDSAAFLNGQLAEFVERLRSQEVLVCSTEELNSLKGLVQQEVDRYLNARRWTPPTPASVMAAYREIMLDTLSASSKEGEKVTLDSETVKDHLVSAFKRLI